MLQIAIWGIAAMLIVKALDVLHQQSISRASGTPGSEALSTIAAVLAVVSAISLIYLAGEQVKASSPTLGDAGSALSYPQGYSDDALASATDAAEAARAAAEDAARAAADAAKKM
ncbi:MAG: hypothetical protein ACKOQ3_10470 [Novosphingobium sp.]